MLKTISNFIEHLSPSVKNFGIKAKEGLHVFIRPEEQEDQIELKSPKNIRWVFTRKKEIQSEDIKLLEKAAKLSSISWCVNTNKCFDLPTKAIHSCSPFCIAIKKENLIGGAKYKSNSKSRVYDRISSYFDKSIATLATKSAIQQAVLFKNSLQTETQFHGWLDQIPEYADIKDNEYVVLYLDTDISYYEEAHQNYLADKLFNTNEYNTQIDDETYGTSDFFNGYNSKKPFLTHHTAFFDIASRISSKEAKNLYEFSEILRRNILPRPLPLFIHFDELNLTKNKTISGSFITLLEKETAQNQRISYQEIWKRLLEEYDRDIGNFYLLYYERDEIKDFDFVPKFLYQLKDANGQAWEVQNLFNSESRLSINSVFDFQHSTLVILFNNELITKTKNNTFIYRYFEELDRKSDNIGILMRKYRKALYDYIYKSKKSALPQIVFDDICQTSILEDIRVDKIEFETHKSDWKIKQKMNIWFSLSDHFNLNKSPNQRTMASKLKEYKEFEMNLISGNETISTDEQYAFTIGQLIYYLLTKSKSKDNSYKRLEPFLQQSNSKGVNQAISTLFNLYKHETFTDKFSIAMAEALTYETSTSIREVMPILLAGFFSKNVLFRNEENNKDNNRIETETATN